MQDIHDIKLPVQVGIDLIIINSGIAFFILIVIGFIIYFIFKFFKKKKQNKKLLFLPAPLSPDKTAIIKLDLIQNLMKQNPRLFYFELTKILKNFIGKSFNINAPEMTSQELFSSLKNIEKKIFSNINISDIKDFFFFSDSIKYARKFPLMDIMKKHEKFLRDFITSVSQSLENIAHENKSINYEKHEKNMIKKVE